MKNLFYTSPKYLQNLKGIKSSALMIDNRVKSVVYVSDFENGAKTSKAINLAINYAKANGITIVQADYGDYAFTQASLVEIPYWVSGGTRPCVYLPSDIHLFGMDKYKTRYIMDQAETKSVSMIETNATDNTGVYLCTLYGNRVDDDVFIQVEREGINYKDGCTNTSVIKVHFENIENEAIDIDIIDYDTIYLLNKFQYTIKDCTFLNIGGVGVHNANWTTIDNCTFDNVSRKRYLGMKAGSAGTDGQGAIDSIGHMGIYNNCIFTNCVRATHTHNVQNQLDKHTHELNNAIVRDCSFSADGITEVSMSLEVGKISNLNYESTNPMVEAYFINGKSKIVANPVIVSNKYIPIKKADDIEVIGLSVSLKGSKEDGHYLKNSLIDKRGNTQAQMAVEIIGSTPESNDIINNRIFQDGAYAAVGTTNASNAGGHTFSLNKIYGGSHSMKISNNCIVTENICTNALSWGVTIEGSNNIVSLNKTNKETRNLGTNNIVINNQQVV